MDIKDLTIRKFSAGLKDKKFSAREVMEETFRNIEAKDKDIHAYLSLRKNEALEEASKIDAQVKDGHGLSPLAGIPMAIKDNLLIKGGPATASSKILKNYVSAYDATVIQKLKDAKAIFTGKTNLDEFAMGSSTENSAYGPTHNPHDLTRVPGGSSGGSAAAVAADMALGALGTDTGGSIRQPAAMCGVVGLKPTYGAVSRYGAIAMASSLDQIGPFAKTVEDAALIFDAIRGLDPKDATSVDAYLPTSHEILNPDFQKIKKLTVGIPEEYFGEGLDREVAAEMENVMTELKGKGINFKKISLPHTKYALSVYYIIMPAEVSTNLARFDGIRYGTREKAGTLLDLYYSNKGLGYGPETKRRIILGTFVLSSGYYDAYYAKAQKVRSLIKQDFDEAYKSVDLIFTPVTPTPAFKIGEKASDPLQMYLSDVFTIPAPMAGIPAISIPVKGREGKLPVGFQLMAPHWREADLFGLGRLYEGI